MNTTTIKSRPRRASRCRVFCGYCNDIDCPHCPDTIVVSTPQCDAERAEVRKIGASVASYLRDQEARRAELEAARPGWVKVLAATVASWVWPSTWSMSILRARRGDRS